MSLREENETEKCCRQLTKGLKYSIGKVFKAGGTSEDWLTEVKAIYKNNT